MSAAVMVCPSPSMTDAYVKKAQEAAQKRYAEKDDDHRKEKAATKALHTAHPSILAAADEAGGLPALPDNERRRGRDALLGVDTPLKKIQTVLSAHGAARSTSRALSLAASPMRLRAPATTPSSRLVANGVVHTLDTMTAPSTAGPSEPNVASLLDALGVFDLFKKRYTIKDDAVYLGLVKKVLVEEGISGPVKIQRISRLRFVSQSLSSYGGGAAPAAIPGSPLAAPPRVFDLAGEAAPSPPLGGVGGEGAVSPFGAGGDRRPAAAPTSIAVRALLAAAAAVLTLSAVKDKDVLTHDYHKVKDKTAVVRVLGGCTCARWYRGVVAASSAAARGGSGAASAAATAAAADTLAGGGAAASAAAHPAAAEPPSRHVWGTAAVGADVFASAAADATTAATPGDSAELAVATAAAAAIAAGGGAAEFTAAPPAAARPRPATCRPHGGGPTFSFRRPPPRRRRPRPASRPRLWRTQPPTCLPRGRGWPTRASPAAVASAATNPGGSSGVTAACAAAAANSAGGGHTILPATPLAIPPPFPRPGTATVVPDTGFVASAAGSAMDLSSDANPAAGELPAASASPTATVASATRPPPTAGAPAAAPPPRTAVPSPPGEPAAPPPAKKAVRRRHGRRSGASSASAMPAEEASGMDVDDPLAAATAADRQGGSAAAPPRRRLSPLPPPRPGPPRGHLPPPRCRRQRAPRRLLRRRCRRRPRGRPRAVAALPPPISRVVVRRQGVVRVSQSDAPGPPRPGWRVRSPPPAVCCAAPRRCRRRLGRMCRQRGRVCCQSHSVSPAWLTRIYV
ncbi:hypothetical protein BU14_0138s0027 [Porphyra umbilicalis]|uniref:Uncharacterized protein n=1 Tax=Porphyra umbilicalis TaxID=2786 RepID=A0A1X6P9V8_PORUM|nr:hypothetical protein BU14_0138s0027 [Porphyra umbilicalis]|eukprot:OSX77681.1 hypothetical protein BU14_0138s0027 [Porphyra umbilicalis]